jgi:hypothetical protein
VTWVGGGQAAGAARALLASCCTGCGCLLVSCWLRGHEPSAVCTCTSCALPNRLQAKRRFLLGPGSGLADLRGQHSGATSKFGLRFNN